MATKFTWQVLRAALVQLEWSDLDCTADQWPTALVTPSSGCWFRSCLASSSSGCGPLNSRGRAQLERIVAAGWSLRSRWPRAWQSTLRSWLGPRLFLGHARLFKPEVSIFSLVSSQIGRGGSRYPHWPGWIDQALRHVSRQRGRLLIAPGTTLAASLEQYARRAAVELVRVHWETASPSSPWLADWLAGLARAPGRLEPATDELWLSPAWQPAHENFAAYPLQDRLSIALADRLLAMSIRPAGKLQQLLVQRLAEPNFPVGSVFVTLASLHGSSAMTRVATHARTRSEMGRNAKSQPLSWLSLGAVGWLTTPAESVEPAVLSACRQALATRHAPPFTQQLISPLPAQWSAATADDASDYLVHCTRGSLGPRADESAAAFRQRAWAQGVATASHPLQTLWQICSSGRLRGTAAMTRTSARCVSFSAVPLVPLLARRTFRPHLGRWDWEPYGLMIRRSALQAYGARPVIYGDETVYQQLPSDDQAYFQPSTRRDQGAASWCEEREWRVVGDVDLRLLNVDSIALFVRTAVEARHCARHSPWPVFWIEAVSR